MQKTHMCNKPTFLPMPDVHRSALKHTHTMTTIANTMRIAAPTVAACSSSRSITQQAGTLPSKGRPAHQAPRKGARGSTTRSALMANRPQEVGNDTYDTYGTVEQALAAACLSLGRPFGEPEQALVARLRANWYTHATDLVAMDTVCWMCRVCGVCRV